MDRSIAAVAVHQSPMVKGNPAQCATVISTTAEMGIIDSGMKTANGNAYVKRKDKMGDSRKAFADDQERYESLCRKYHEKPESDGVLGSDPYSDHAQRLFERDRREHERP